MTRRLWLRMCVLLWAMTFLDLDPSTVAVWHYRHLGDVYPCVQVALTVVLNILVFWFTVASWRVYRESQKVSS